ncbi:bacterial Ig-like domain-containing protein, partial [Enterococcus faecalis]|nr:bacterial Ig-like domain-containing protein [Enterococcus faecalis]ELT8947888.1 bacterial Ig-like domain-containing protein [Enterococcus faecalis]
MHVHKKIILFLLALIILLLSPSTAHGTTGTFEKNFNSQSNEAIAKVIDFKTDKKNAVQWSNEKFPMISNFVNTNSEVEKVRSINDQLRTKYLNRDELYNSQEDLIKLDNSFITEAAQDITLYANLSAENFGISSSYFHDNQDRVFEDMLKNTQYGIDYGYFLGDLTAQPFDSNKRESVQIKLKVPKGTRMIRVGSEKEAKYMIPRKNTFEYTEKKLDKTTKFPHIYVSAILVSEDKFNIALKEQQIAISEKLENLFNIKPNFLKLVPLGLNAGNVISNSQEVALKPFTIMQDNKILSNNMFDKETLILTSGFPVHTDVFNKVTEGLSIDERRNKFEQLYKSSMTSKKLGQTTNWHLDKTSTTVVRFSHLYDKDSFLGINENQDISAAILHEFFHYLIFVNNNYKGSPMFDEDSENFKSKIESLKLKEQNKLAILLNSSHVKKSWEEYICEAFLAQNHPKSNIQTKFRTDIVLTNRLLVNLFDYEAPTSPQYLKETEVTGDSIKFSFDHSVDNTSVEKYNIYMDGKFVKSYKTIKDKNGLHSPNPSRDGQKRIVVFVDGLKQMKEYEFRVTAVDEAQNESAKSTPLKVKTKDTEPPKLIGNLGKRVLTSSLVQLQLPKAIDNVGVSKIKIRRMESSSSLNFYILPKSEIIYELPKNSRYYNDATIMAGKQYTYSMTAVDEAGNESERSNEVVVRTKKEDDKKENEEKAEDTTSSETRLNWKGSFEGISASSFSIFSWVFKAGSWTFSGVTSVSGTVTSSIVALIPGMSHQFLILPLDNEGDPLSDGLKISIDSTDQSSIQTKDSTLYVGQKWNPEDNFVSATDE